MSEQAGEVRVALPDYPFHPNDVMTPDTELLDGLARAYAREAGGGPLEMPRFLFGVAPLALFESAFESEGPDGIPAAGLLWILHLSGYFGGLWLRREILRAQPSSFLRAAGREPTAEAFAEGVDAARAGIEAWREGGDAALAHAELNLSQLVAHFGYNQGYLLQILESPPKGERAPADLVVPRGPLWCDYATPRLRALAGLRHVAERLAAPDSDAWRKTAGEVVRDQRAAVDNGRRVWSSGLSVEGLDARAYAQLLEVSASFLEVIQATALAALGASLEGDAGLARRAAVANAGLAPWLGSYASGLMDPRFDDADTAPLPSFAR